MRIGFSCFYHLNAVLSWRQATKAALISEILYCLWFFYLHIIRLLKNEAVTLKIGKQSLSNSCLLSHGIGIRRVPELAFCLSTALHPFSSQSRIMQTGSDLECMGSEFSKDTSVTNPDQTQGTVLDIAMKYIANSNIRACR